MSRWFRSYADTHRNPKIAKLSDRDFRLWHNLLCIATENEGVIPPADDLKHILRMRLDHCYGLLKRLIDGALIDPLEAGYAPRNWSERQYKSDISTPRVQAFRAKRNVIRNVSETPPDTESDTDTEKKKEVGGKPPDYAFFGKTIRLKPRDYSEWRRLFDTILDLEAELSVLDGWWQDQADDRRKSWFHATKAMLNKKHQSNLMIEKQAQAPPAWDGMP